MLSRLPWYLAGPMIGLVILAVRAAVNKPFGTLGGYIDIAESVPRLRMPGFNSFVVLGIVFGAALFALLTGTFAISSGYNAASAPFALTGPPQFIVLAFAGAAMGVGARTAGGCTSGHGLCGMSLGSGASVAATATFFATAMLVAHLVEWLT